MGSVRVSVSSPSTTALRAVPLRALERVAGAVLLVLALPVIAVLALAVRRSSHGPVLHREPGFDARGRPIALLSFRTAFDGAGTAHHERVRAVVGDHEALTGVGRLLRATHTACLPRLLNVARGHTGLSGR